MDWLQSQFKKLKTVHIAKFGEREKSGVRQQRRGQGSKGGEQGGGGGDGRYSTSKNLHSLHKSPKQIELKHSLH